MDGATSRINASSCFDQPFYSPVATKEAQLRNSALIHSVRKKMPEMQQAFQARVQTMVDHRIQQTTSAVIIDSVLEDNFHEIIGIEKENMHLSDDPDDAASTGDGYRRISRKKDPFFNTNDKLQSLINESEKISLSQCVRRNVHSNILSAVLCLVKELDLGSLKVVKSAIHCRREEMSD